MTKLFRWLQMRKLEASSLPPQTNHQSRATSHGFPASRCFALVNVFVFDVAFGISLDRRMIDRRERALHLAGRTHHQTSGRNDRALGYQGSRSDDAAAANHRAVQND